MMERKMKDSGIPWIGVIPSDWNVNKINQLFSIIGSGTTPKATNDSNFVGNINWIQSGDINGGFIVDCKNKIAEQVLSQYSALKLYKQPFIIVAMYGASVGNISISKIDGCVNQACCVMGKSNQYFEFLFYAIKSAKDYLIYRAEGGGQPNISQDKLKNLRIPLPPLPTQQRIADFLDRKCAEIDELAALQETMIAELKRYKQSVITEAVTKGLDPNVPMKDSGVEWIGEIPEGWEVKKVKNVTTAITKGNGITKEDVFDDGDTPCVRYGEIYSKYDNSFVACISKTKKDVLSTLHYFGNGDILCAGTGELVEEIGKSIVYLGENQCLAGGDIIVLCHNQNPLFLNFALNSRYAQAQKSCSKAKLKVVHISAYDIGSILIALPSLSEQRAIADYLDRKCAEINELIAIKQQKIEALKEYKKSVIFECVTGKKEID